MRYCTTNYFEKRQDHFVCANYRSNTGSCSAHFIRAVVLEELVWMHMRTVIFLCHVGMRIISGPSWSRSSGCPAKPQSVDTRSVWHRPKNG